MNSQEVFREYGQEVYFFILGRVNDRLIASDIFQNSFLKIHKNIHQLKNEKKLRAWVFQISRNEISNYFNAETNYAKMDAIAIDDKEDTHCHVCCFDRFIDELPKIYMEAIKLTFIVGKKQQEASDILGISLANYKARVRRGKELLTSKFQLCCKYEMDQSGKLTGPSDCPTCF